MGPEPGVVLGERYRVIGRIGAGGVATVYEVEHVDLLVRFALKLLAGDLARMPEVAERFLREARIAARIDVPQVVRVVDFGRWEGRPYLVMERLLGRTLGEHLRAGALAPRTAIALLLEVLEGLEAAHALGVVHRDLKPDNLFVVEGDGESPTIKILDLGIAKIAAPIDDVQTVAGAVFGTPRYMAPEQATGESVDHRADLYAVGVIAFEALAGRPPYVGANAQQTLHQHVAAPVPRLPLDPVEGIDVEAVARVLERALQKRPADRPQSARELGSALRACVGPSAPRAGTGGTHLARGGAAVVRGLALGRRASARIWTAIRLGGGSGAGRPPEGARSPSETESASIPLKPAEPVPPTGRIEAAAGRLAHGVLRACARLSRGADAIGVRLRRWTAQVAARARALMARIRAGLGAAGALPPSEAGAPTPRRRGVVSGARPALLAVALVLGAGLGGVTLVRGDRGDGASARPSPPETTPGEARVADPEPRRRLGSAAAGDARTGTSPPTEPDPAPRPVSADEVRAWGEPASWRPPESMPAPDRLRAPLDPEAQTLWRVALVGWSRAEASTIAPIIDACAALSPRPWSAAAAAAPQPWAVAILTHLAEHAPTFALRRRAYEGLEAWRSADALDQVAYLTRELQRNGTDHCPIRRWYVERLAALRDPATRATLIAERDRLGGFLGLQRRGGCLVGLVNAALAELPQAETAREASPPR